MKSAIYNNMDGPGGYYIKWYKSHRERQVPDDFTYNKYMWNLKNKINGQVQQKQTQTEGTFWWLPDRRVVGGMSEKDEGI